MAAGVDRGQPGRTRVLTPPLIGETVTAPVLMRLCPQDAEGAELDVYELFRSEHDGFVAAVPAVGDGVWVVLADGTSELWTVVSRDWVIPIPHERASEPKQMVNVRIRRQEPQPEMRHRG